MRQKDSTYESAHQTICQRKARRCNCCRNERSPGGITGCRAAVAKINTANETGGTNKLKGISKLNNFEFTEARIRVWCAYQIGLGSLVTYVGKTAQGETGMKLLLPFGASPQGRNNDSGPHSHILLEPRNEVFFSCDAPGCVLTFRNENEAQDYMDPGTHQLVLEGETVYDTIRRK